MAGSKIKRMLSVVVPAFAQEGSIGQDMLRIQTKIEEISNDIEIVLVNDGAVDRTAERAQSVAGPNTRIEIIPENRGKGYAVRRGISMTRGDIVGFIDAGGDIDPVTIETAAKLVDRGIADIAIASKIASMIPSSPDWE